MVRVRVRVRVDGWMSGGGEGRDFEDVSGIRYVLANDWQAARKRSRPVQIPLLPYQRL